MGDQAVDIRLRRAGTAIAILIGQKEYPTLRIGDRHQLRHFQAGILAWLRGSESNRSEGEELWKNLVTFAELLVLINRREELVRHDSEVLQRAYRGLRATDAAPERVPEALLRDLLQLEGLDDRIFDLIESGREVESAAWFPILDDLYPRYVERAAELGGAGPERSNERGVSS